MHSGLWFTGYLSSEPESDLPKYKGIKKNQVRRGKQQSYKKPTNLLSLFRWWWFEKKNSRSQTTSTYISKQVEFREDMLSCWFIAPKKGNDHRYGIGILSSTYLTYWVIFTPSISLDSEIPGQAMLNLTVCSLKSTLAMNVLSSDSPVNPTVEEHVSNLQRFVDGEVVAGGMSRAADHGLKWFPKGKIILVGRSDSAEIVLRLARVRTIQQMLNYFYTKSQLTFSLESSSLSVPALSLSFLKCHFSLVLLKLSLVK